MGQEKVIHPDNVVHPMVKCFGKTFFGAALLVMLSVSCSKNVVFDDVARISDEGWQAGQKYTFQVPVSDTLAAYDILIHSRNKSSYEFSNLWLFIETIAPSGESMRDTTQIILADETGHWLGHGLSSVNTMLTPYKTNIRFPYRGIYVFEIRQGMRKEMLEDIIDIGLRVQITE